jgi:hypothetical protein
MLGKCSYINPNISEFFLAEWDSSIVPIYSSNNVILRYEWILKDWFEIKINTAAIAYSQQMSTSNSQGIFYDEKIQIIIPKAENSKWLELIDILTKRYIIIFKDANDQWFTAGYRYGVQVKAYQLSENEYVISFECTNSNNLPTFIDENYVKNNVWISPTPTPTPSISSTPSNTPSSSPSLTPSISVSTSVGISPSTTPSITVSRTPNISSTPSHTPTISISPSKTPSITPSITPSFTPEPSQTPTPTSTPSISVGPYYYAYEMWNCPGTYETSTNAAFTGPLVINKWYALGHNSACIRITGTHTSGSYLYPMAGPFDSLALACAW